MSEARQVLGTPSMDGRDESLRDMGVSLDKSDRKNWRDALYMSMKKSKDMILEHVSINVRMQYRADTKRIWSIRVMDTWKVFRCSFYGLDNHARFDEIRKILGRPLKTKEESGSLDSHWWIKDDLGFHLRVYSRDLPDVGVTHYKGEAQWVLVCSLKAAPPGIASWFGG
jgi:hypothetical protein